VATPGRIRIRRINKTPRNDPWDRIESIGGVGGSGARWNMPEDDAVAQVENGTYSFYVAEGDNSVDVVITTHSGRKYLKTTADGDHPDNLLSLPECP
jgi:Protein of unknown function (DUF3892)